MPTLIKRSSGETEEWELGSFSLSIGRHPDSNVLLPSVAVSPEHAVISFSSGRYYVEDVRGSSGTRVNGTPVTRQALADGDLIQIGPETLEFRAPEPARAARPLPSQPERRFEPEPGSVTPGQTDVGLLDRLVGSIRSFRDREQQERAAAQAQLQVEWEKTLAYAEQLKRKVHGDPRVKYFEISRRNHDVLIRVQRSASLPVQFLSLSREHPDEKGHALSGIWFRRSEQPDRCYRNADEAVAELIRELAFLIA